jgi:hypothetical protein
LHARARRVRSRAKGKEGKKSRGGGLHRQRSKRQSRRKGGREGMQAEMSHTCAGLGGRRAMHASVLYSIRTSSAYALCRGALVPDVMLLAPAASGGTARTHLAGYVPAQPATPAASVWLRRRPRLPSFRPCRAPWNSRFPEGAPSPPSVSLRRQPVGAEWALHPARALCASCTSSMRALHASHRRRPSRKPEGSTDRRSRARHDLTASASPRVCPAAAPSLTRGQWQRSVPASAGGVTTTSAEPLS